MTDDNHAEEIVTMVRAKNEEIEKLRAECERLQMEERKHDHAYDWAMKEIPKLRARAERAEAALRSIKKDIDAMPVDLTYHAQRREHDERLQRIGLTARTALQSAGHEEGE